MSGPGTGPGNMAMDEALLVAGAEGGVDVPTFRLYSWQGPCLTIGYFQKHADFAAMNLPVTRRLTGGLSVNHGFDLSYAFVAAKDHWPHIYNQEKTYEMIHRGVKRGLELLGRHCAFYQGISVGGSDTPGNGICVQTVYPYDLHINGRKILGSCQRRRGASILQQGSVHIRFTEDCRSVAKAFEQGVAAELGVRFEQAQPADAEFMLSQKLAAKYISDEWNRKY